MGRETLPDYHSVIYTEVDELLELLELDELELDELELDLLVLYVLMVFYI